MSTMPRPLAPWSAALSGLRPAAAEALGPWAPRLWSALARMTPRRSPEGDDPDGYGGLARRGDWERLLVSEWALADAVPDEFLRRAASGEQLFLDRERTHPRSDRRTVVLFDTGPDQVGAPRLLHLAILVVLARRLDGPLGFGSLQDPRRVLHVELGRHTAAALAASRTTARATAGHVAAWRDALEPTDLVWFVTTEPFTGEQVLAITEGEGELTLAVHARGAPVERLALPLPAPAVAAEVLRDPFPPSVPTPSRSPGGVDGLTVVWEARGHHLWLCTRTRAVSTRAPGGVWANPRGTTVHTVRAPPLAVGRFRRRRLLLAYGEGSLWVDESAAPIPFSGPASGPPAALWALPPDVAGGERRNAAAFVDAWGTLWAVDLDRGDAIPILTAVSAPFVTDWGALVTRQEARPCLVAVGASRTADDPRAHAARGIETRSVHLAPGVNLPPVASRQLVGARTTDEHGRTRTHVTWPLHDDAWCVVEITGTGPRAIAETPSFVTVSDDLDVIALVHAQGPTRPILLALDAERERVHRIDGATTAVHLELPGAALSWDASPRGQVAVALEGGQVVVFGEKPHEVLLTFPAGPWLR